MEARMDNGTSYDLTFRRYDYTFSLPDGQRITRSFVVLERSDGFFWFTNFHQFIRSPKAISHNITQHGVTRFDFIISLLNYAFFVCGIARLEDLTVDIVQRYLRSYSSGTIGKANKVPQKQTVERCLRYAFDFLDIALLDESIHFPFARDDLYREIAKRDKRGAVYTAKVPVFAVEYIQTPKKPLNRDIPEKAFFLLFDHIVQNHTDILGLVIASAFAGCRPGEAVNIRCENSPLGPGIRFTTINGGVVKIEIDLTQEMVLRSDNVIVGNIKKERIQRVPRLFIPAFVKCYKIYEEYMVNRKREPEYMPFSTNRRGKAMTYEEGKYRAKQCRSCFLADPRRYTPVAAVQELVRFWDFEKNAVDINTMASNSEIVVNWHCRKCGYRWSSSPRIRMKASGCPCCDSGKRVKAGFNDAITKCPDLIRLFDSSLNPGKDLSACALHSDIFFTWKCDMCGYIWDASVENTVQSSCHCPNCMNRRAIPGVNSLADKYPDLASMWSDKNPRSPSEILCNSYSWATWRCHVCGGEFSAYPVDMVSGKSSCPFCANKRVLPGFNSLAAKRPDLAKLWCDEDASPDEIFPYSSYRARWLCPICNGIYRASVGDMVLSKTHCPYCADERVLPGFNSFAVKHPELMGEWNHLNNYALCDPDTIGETCDTVVWWVCSKNHSHSYTMSPRDRLMYQKRLKVACPFCKGRRRKKRHVI